jgi:hypothetical protein
MESNRRHTRAGNLPGGSCGYVGCDMTDRWTLADSPEETERKVVAME